MTTNMSGAPMWDQRYSTTEYLFGTDPAAFLTRHADLLEPGSEALVVADGEGRNSVYLAAHGLHVTAMDVSEVGVGKARRLAIDRGATVEFQVADIMEWEWAPDTYDVVVAVFIQFLDPQQRSTVFDGMQRTLRPGGRLLLHGYRLEQIRYATRRALRPGTPLRRDVSSPRPSQRWRSRCCTHIEATIGEGTGHTGMSALIDLVATKR